MARCSIQIVFQHCLRMLARVEAHRGWCAFRRQRCGYARPCRRDCMALWRACACNRSYSGASGGHWRASVSCQMIPSQPLVSAHLACGERWATQECSCTHQVGQDSSLGNRCSTSDPPRATEAKPLMRVMAALSKQAAGWKATQRVRWMFQLGPPQHQGRCCKGEVHPRRWHTKAHLGRYRDAAPHMRPLMMLPRRRWETPPTTPVKDTFLSSDSAGACGRRIADSRRNCQPRG